MTKVLLLFHENRNVFLHVLYKIISKINVKVVIAKNYTDLSCIKLDLNVSECFTKAFCNIDIKFNTGQLSAILGYYDFYTYFIYNFVQDL